jgi:hypothetical protein
MDQCNDVLTHAAYSFTTMSKTDSFSRDLKTFFLSDRFNTWLHDQKGGFSIGLPPIGDLPPLQIGAQASDSDITAFKERIVNMSEEQFRSYSDYYLKKQVVEPKALEEWGKCMAGHAATDIHGTVTVVGTTVEVALRWERIGKEDKTPVIKTFYYEPLVPVGQLQLTPGKSTIDTDGVLQRFKRTTTEEVLVSVSTTRGTWQAKIDSLPPPPTAKWLCWIFRQPTDPEYKIDVTGSHISLCRQLTENKFRESGNKINYGFKLQRYDKNGKLVAQGALMDDRFWPPATMLDE